MTRRLAVAGVIRRAPEGKPQRRKVAVLADWGHPQGPAAATAVWDSAWDQRHPQDPPLRVQMLDHVFQDLADTLEVDQ